MRESRKPLLARDGFEDSLGIEKALGELADISQMRSQAHEAANLFRDFHIEIGSLTERRLRRELSQAEGVLARWAIMAANEEFRTVDLARVENKGDWDATTEAEEGIGRLAVSLFMDGQIDGLVERNTPEAKLRIMVDPGLLSEQGLIAIRRKRLMLATKPVPHEFSDMRPVRHLAKGRSVPRGHAMTADTHLEIDKVSEFVLDFDRMLAADSRAAGKLRQAAYSGVAEITTDDFARAAAAIEDAIDARDPMLAPAITTYYADRKYKHIHRIDNDERATAPVGA